MKSFFNCCVLVTLLLLAVPVTKADIARPSPSPKSEGKFVMNTGLEITVDPKASNARLQIQESDLKELRTALAGGDENRTFATTIMSSPGRTMIAGVLLFLSLSFAGVWLARSKRVDAASGRSHRLVLILVVGLSLLGAAAVITRGNAGPPPSFRWRNLADNLAKGQSTVGSVNIEVVPDNQVAGRGMKLIIPLKTSNGRGEE